MPLYRFYLHLCKCFLQNKNIPAKSVCKLGSCFTNSMARWKVQGRVGREVRDEDREGEKEGRASTQLLHCAMEGPLTLWLGSPFGGQSWRHLGLPILPLREVPDRTVQNVPHIIWRDENYQHRERILFFWEAEGNIWKTSVHCEDVGGTVWEPIRREWKAVMWEAVISRPVALKCEKTQVQLLPTLRKCKWFLRTGR